MILSKVSQNILGHDIAKNILGHDTLSCGACLMLLERLCRHMVEDNETRGREEPWLHLGVLQGTR
jgi:hypothetical protein